MDSQGVGEQDDGDVIKGTAIQNERLNSPVGFQVIEKCNEGFTRDVCTQVNLFQWEFRAVDEWENQLGDLG